MINNINFFGQSFKAHIYTPGCIKQTIKPYEKKFFTRYAKENKCDVLLLNRNFYNDGIGIFDTIIVKPDKNTKSIIVDYRKFDFKRPIL